VRRTPTAASKVNAASHELRLVLDTGATTLQPLLSCDSPPPSAEVFTHACSSVEQVKSVGQVAAAALQAGTQMPGG
jgi:hypothetical protein